MIEPRVIVSLVDDAAASDRFLETVHRLLPATRAGRIAVLRPPNPRLFGAVARTAGPETIVVVEGPQGLPPTDMLRDSPAQWMAWCRDDDEVDRCDPGVIPVRADDVDSLAWEVVRRAAGDGGDASSTIPASGSPVLRPVTRADVAGTSAPIAEEGGSASEPATVDPLAGRIRPPAWALGSPEAEFDEGDGGGPPSAAARKVQHPVPPTWAGGSLQLRGLPATPPPVPAAAATELGQDDVSNSSIDQSSVPERMSDPRSPLASLASRLPPIAPEMNDPPPSPGRGTSSPSAAFEPDRREAERRAPSRSWLPDFKRAGLGWRTRTAAPSEALAGLGQDLVRCHSTVVLVGTSKGGPGKTTQAAAISLLGAQAVEPHGGSAVFVDANLNNPDAWKRLGLPVHAATVRELVDALNRGATAPEGETARDARLRVYPEARGGGASYSAAEIDRLAHHLRVHNTLVVVDLPNVLPSLLDGPTEAVMAHWLRHADVFVLPVDLGGGSFVAAGEMLDALDEFITASDGLRAPGVVVPVLVPRGGAKVVRSPQVAELLDHLRDAGAAVVEVPQVIEVQVADHFRRPVVGASPEADAAFARVLDAVVAVARARGNGPDGAHGSA